MPVIGGADENGVNVFVFEQFPEIGIDLTGGTHRSPSLFGVGFIDIAKGDEVSIGGLSHEVANVLAASSAADQADTDSFIGAINSGGTGGGDGKEISTIHGEYYIESPPPERDDNLSPPSVRSGRLESLGGARRRSTSWCSNRRRRERWGVAVETGGRRTFVGLARVAAVVPGLFAADASGIGLAAANLVTEPSVFVLSL